MRRRINYEIVYDFAEDKVVPYNSLCKLVQDATEKEYNRFVALQNKVDTLYDVLAHGDEAHRAWLKQTIERHFDASN